MVVAQFRDSLWVRLPRRSLVWHHVRCSYSGQKECRRNTRGLNRLVPDALKPGWHQTANSTGASSTASDMGSGTSTSSRTACPMTVVCRSSAAARLPTRSREHDSSPGSFRVGATFHSAFAECKSPIGTARPTLRGLRIVCWSSTTVSSSVVISRSAFTSCNCQQFVIFRRVARRLQRRLA